MRDQKLNTTLMNNLTNDIMVCDEKCQKEKRINKLHKEYLDSKNSFNNNKSRLEDTEKQYYTELNGSSWYLNHLEEKTKPEANDLINMYNNELTNNIDKINLLLDDYKTTTKGDVLSNDLLNKYQQQRNYFNTKKDIIENSKNVASRKNYYDMNYLLFYKTLVKYVSIIVWIAVFIFIYFKYVQPRLFNRKSIIQILILLISIYSLGWISKKIAALYQSYMIGQISNYKDLEYKILEAKDL